MKNNIPLFKVFMSDSVTEKVSEVLKSGFIGQGPVVENFEENLKQYFRHDKLVSLNSATSAEHLALHLLKKPNKFLKGIDGYGQYESTWPGIEIGDEVLTTPLTCTATN